MHSGFFSLVKESLPIEYVVGALGQELSQLVCAASDTCQRHGAAKSPQRHREGDLLLLWVLPCDLGPRTYLLLDSAFLPVSLLLKQLFEIPG